MSVLAATARGGGTGAPPSPGPQAGPLRRHRSAALIVGSLVLAVVAVLLLGPHRSGRTAADDPENPGLDGAQALARVLEQDGVDVTIVRSADAFDAAALDDRTSVVVTSAGQLGRTTVQRLIEHVQGAHLVVVDPSYALLRALQIDDHPASLGSDAPVAADCPSQFGGLFEGLSIQVDGATTFAGSSCFGASGRGALVQRHGITLFGAGQALTNEQVTRADNAAVALRLLGRDPRLVWYVPTYDDQVAGDGVGLGSLLPDYLGPGLLMSTIAFLGLMLWRGRRLGPLATEPLPVVVRAIETTRSLGRLYRRSGDRVHTAHVLRSAAQGRIIEHLRLGAAVDEQTLVGAVARHLDRPEGEIAALLGGDAPFPTSDPDLIHLANALAELDREVRRT